MKLDLYLNSKMVATTVERSRGRQVVLEYTDQVDRDHPPETALLSCSLPTPGPSRPAATRAFLEGLLLEGEALRTIAATSVGARLDLEEIAPATTADAVHLLAEYGRECAGAVAVVPHGTPYAAGFEGSYRTVSDQQIANLLDRLPTRPLGADLLADIRMSLAGAQAKLLLARIDGRWAEPVGGLPSTHILKPTGRWPLSADNETIVMELARHAGLTDMSVWVEDFGDQRVFVTERFDRIVDGSSPVKRLHQEDMCQALGLRPRDKYQIGRPSQNMARLLRRWAADPARSVRELFSQLVFRAVVGDEDGHGKNYGLLLEGGKVAVAPLYDCLSTQIYPSLAGRMGTQLGRQVNLAAVDLTALVEEGVACGIGESEATQLVDTLADRILAAMQAISPPSVDVRALECVLGTIGLRVRRL